MESILFFWLFAHLFVPLASPKVLSLEKAQSSFGFLLTYSYLCTEKSKNRRKTMKQTILAISGKPGLYKLVSRAKNSLIVEALDDTHKRIPAFGTDRITSLADIAMFTDTDDVPLMNVLAAIRDLEGGKASSVDFRKASPKELHDYFSKVVPNWDQDRVQNSHLKKLIQWYNFLVKAGITDFEEEMAPTEGDNIDDRQ